MDDFFIHAVPFPRHFPAGRAVQGLGHLARKTNRVSSRFQTFNFSVIFEGNGDFQMDGRRWAVRAPCVITQWPGVHVDYGPEGWWQELYLVYPPEHQRVFEEMNFASRQKPVWFFGEPGPCRKILAQIHTLGPRLAEPGNADRLDRLCDQLVLETYLGAGTGEGDPQDLEVRKIRALVDAQPLEDHDFDALAYEHGFSPANFRRHWARVVGPPPWRYVTQLRMQQACRLLAETRLPVREIALRLRFQDPLYFSRVFRSVIRQTARDYRRQHQTPDAVTEGGPEPRRGSTGERRRGKGGR